MRLAMRYFAWVRERVGVDTEMVDVPAAVTDAAALIDWLADRGDGHAAAFAEPKALRVAFDMQQVEMDAPLADVREVAIYPPMTGG